MPLQSRTQLATLHRGASVRVSWAVFGSQSPPTSFWPRGAAPGRGGPAPVPLRTTQDVMVTMQYDDSVEAIAPLLGVGDAGPQTLAVSTPVDSVWANPREIITASDRWPELAKALNLKVAEIRDKTEKYKNRSYKSCRNIERFGWRYTNTGKVIVR